MSRRAVSTFPRVQAIFEGLNPLAPTPTLSPTERLFCDVIFALMSAPVLTLVFSLLSGVVGAFGSTYYYIQYERSRFKKDALRRFAASRGALTEEDQGSEKEFTRAVNQLIVVFNDDPEVMDALSDFREAASEGAGAQILRGRIIALFEAMCDASDVKYDHFDDLEILSPFSP